MKQCVLTHLRWKGKGYSADQYILVSHFNHFYTVMLNVKCSQAPSPRPHLIHAHFPKKNYTDLSLNHNCVNVHKTWMDCWSCIIHAQFFYLKQFKMENRTAFGKKKKRLYYVRLFDNSNSHHLRVKSIPDWKAL